ncbi:MAG: permease [Eubacteriales bacterium]
MKEILKKFKIPIMLCIIILGLKIFIPETGNRSISVMIDYSKEMAIIMPAVFLLMGFMEVWIDKDKIKNWLGSKSGLKGGLIAFILGTLPTGPLYAAFPMAASLIKKEASIFNIVIFLGAWAALKIPQLMVEIKFLGLAFTALRFVLTLAGLIIIGSIMNIAFKKKSES